MVITGHDQVTIYPDRLVMRTNSFWEMVTKWQGTIYKFDELESASMPVNEKPKVFEIAAIAILALLVKVKSTRQYDPFYLNLKNGREIQLITSFHDDQKLQIINLVNENISKLKCKR